MASEAPAAVTRPIPRHMNAATSYWPGLPCQKDPPAQVLLGGRQLDLVEVRQASCRRMTSFSGHDGRFGSALSSA
jgi:hypothetical protein